MDCDNKLLKGGLDKSSRMWPQTDRAEDGYVEGRQGDGGRGGVPGSVGVSRGAAAPSAPLSENPQGQRRRGGHSLVS